MKRIIFILALFVSFVANSQYTPPPGYTNINARYDWLAGVFRALRLPAGGNAAFTTGQAQRAGSVYYDSTGADAGLKVWNGAAWVGVGEVTQSALDDTAAAIRGDFPAGGFFTPNQTSTGATVHNASLEDFTLDSVGTFSIKRNAITRLLINGSETAIQSPDGLTFLQAANTGISVFAGPTSNNGRMSLGDNVASFGLESSYTTGLTLVPSLATFRNTTGSLNVQAGGGASDSLRLIHFNFSDDTTLHKLQARNTVSGALVDTYWPVGGGNLLFDSLGTAGISPVTTRNDTLYARRISVSGGSIDTTASGGLLITVTGGGGGITDLNTLTDATQTFATGTTGTNFNISSAAGVHTFNIPDASVTARGLITTGTQTIEGTKYFGADSYAGTDATDLQVSGSTVLGTGSGSSEVVIANANTTTGTSGLGFRNNAGTQFALLRSFNASSVATLSGIAMASGFSFQSMINNAPLVIISNNGAIHLSPNSTNPALTAISSGRIGLNAITAPTAWLHLPAGTTAASTAPLKFTSGSLQTTAEAGGVEFLTDKYYGTITTSAARKEFTLNDAALTSGRIPFVTTNGRLTDVSTVLWDGATATFPLLKITGGSPGAGKVLTSDADGDATWTTATKPTLTKNATIENPTAADNLGMFRTPVAITITNTHAVLVGSGSPSVTYQISFGTDITALTNVYTAGQTVTSTTTGTSASGVNDATIPADSWVRITTSAATDVTQISLSITYTED